MPGQKSIKPSRNSKLSAAAVERMLQLAPTHKLADINQALIDEGYLEPPGVSINALSKRLRQIKEDRDAAIKAHKDEISRSIAEAVTPALTHDLVGMGTAADEVMQIARDLRALAFEELTLYCETGVPVVMPDGRTVRPLITDDEGKSILRMPRDLRVEIEARTLRMRALVASAGCYRLASMVHLTALQAAGLAPVEEMIPIVCLPEIERVPDVPDEA